ncbi:hypothetical protein SAMN04488490_1871 [Marinobacter sp. LV10R510-11A]|uniref:hypothetical protein n=1 Tax=Marinobacter sp. LV10R510-11A TaxID=1415568 RepID=UPI000BB82E6D|nr:hypothetical protein [Marinobacter sp. LV10R510-11A]SOB76193.1 hypothetical protein SAMN04488490_1871 [Marinobacter sp. LV10R510-11A]
MKLRTSARSAAAQALLTDLSTGGGANPTIQLYDGTIPASMGEAITDTLLATFELSPGIGTEEAGVIAFGAIAGDSGTDAAGLAGWARMIDGGNIESAYLTAGGPGSGADLIITDPNIAVGVPMNISLASISVGG